MIFGFVKKIIGAVFGFVKKIFSWLVNIPDPEDPRGLEIKREGSNQALPVVYGKRLVGGVVVHKWVTDSITGLSGIKSENRKNAYLHQIVAFCHGEIDAYERFLFNGVPSTDGRYNNSFYIATATGSDSQAAISQAVANIPNWASGMTGKRVAYAYFCFYQDKEQSIWRGEPEIQAIIRGRKVYDPRTTLTQWSQNAAICTLDYLTDTVYGRGMSLSQIDVQAFIDAANFCDQPTLSEVTRTVYPYDPASREPPEPVTVVDIREIPRYQMDAVIDTKDTVFNNYRRLLQAFRAFPRRPNGLVSLGVEDEGDSVMSFDSLQGQIFGDITFNVSGQRDRYNSFTITFPNEANNYERDEATYPDVDSTEYQDWLDEDNGKPLKGNLDVNTLANKAAALQSAEIAAKRSRVPGKLRTELDSRARLLEPGDIIDISDNSYGWTAKKFRLASLSETQNNTFQVDLTEHQDAVYPWSGSSWDEVDGGTWLGNPGNPEAPENLAITPDGTLATTGTLTWDQVGDAFVREYQVVTEKVADANGDPISPALRVRDEKTPGEKYIIELLDIGGYIISVYAITTLGYRSGAAAISFTLTVPSAPSSLITEVGDWQIEVRPQLAGLGLGTSFEHDIVQGDGTGHTPVSRVRATAFTHGGLLPDTQYTVYARTVNPYGVSGWLSKTVTTTNTGEQLDSFLNPIRDELDQIDLRVDDIDGGPIDINDLLDQVNQDIIEVFQRREDIDTEQERRVQQFDQLTAEIDSVATATNIRINEVQSDVDGNASAISGLQISVGNLNTGLSSTISRVDQVEIDADGNASAISILQGQVNDPVNNTSALYLTVQDAQTTADGNASSITTILNGVTGESNTAQALLRLGAYFTDGGLGARAFLGTNVSNQITGVIIDDDGVERVIEFVSDSVRFVDGSGTLKIYYDLTNNRYVFDGEINAQAGTFTGTISASLVSGGEVRGAYIRTATSGQRVEIGEGGYGIWMGSGTKNDANADFFIKDNGVGFIKGEFFQGQLLRERAASSTTNTVTVTGHTSAGNDVSVTASINFNRVWTNPTNPGAPGPMTWTIKRNTTTIATGTLLPSRSLIDPAGEPGVDWTVIDVLGGTIGRVDNGTSAGVTYSYTFEITSVSGGNYDLFLQTREDLTA